MKRKAFTFWEALVVVAILAIFAAIFIPPNAFRGPSENARRASCQSNLKQIGLAVIQYAQDAGGKAPPVANARGGWTQLIFPYLKSEAVFQCPSASGNRTGTTDYFTNARIAATSGQVRHHPTIVFTILGGDGADDQNSSYSLSQWPAAWRKDESSPAWRHLDGANTLFVDGHVKWFKPERMFGKPGKDAPTFLARKENSK